MSSTPIFKARQLGSSAAKLAKSEMSKGGNIKPRDPRETLFGHFKRIPD
jgi:hypothetical protein